MKRLAPALLCAGLVPGVQAAAPPVAAVLTHEVRESGGDGVTRSSVYRERFYRSGDRVWIERERPAWAKAQPAPEAHELNINLASRYLERGEGNAARLWLVDAAHKVRYLVGADQYERAAFSGRWDLESMLIDPAELAELGTPVAGAGGARNYEHRKRGEALRITWMPARLFPQLIETGRIDGRTQTRTQAEFIAVPARWPWENLKGYADRELSDLDD